MMIMLFIGLGVVLFVLGISFVFKGYVSTPNENMVVPVKDFEKSKIEIVQLRDSEAKLKKELETLQVNFEKVSREYEIVKTAADSFDLVRQRLTEAEENFLALQGKADAQAKETLEVMQNLTRENTQIKEQLDIYKLDNEKQMSAEEKLGSLRREAEGILKRLQDTQTQLEQSQSESAQLKETISGLSVQIENLKFDHEKDATEIETLKSEHTRQLSQAFESTRLEKQTLQSALEEKIQSQQKLEDELKNLKDEQIKARQELNFYEESNRQLKMLEENRLKQINDMNLELKTLKDSTDMKGSDNSEIIENLRRDKESLCESKAGLDRDLQKVKEFNANLLEKEQMIQYELAKNHAQAMGLQKVCEDFKVEIETKMKEIKDLSLENSSLKRMFEESQKDLFDLKNSHAQLIKQDKLNQYELEKNKTQLAGLEKLYADFRSKFDHMDAVHNEMKEDAEDI